MNPTVIKPQSGGGLGPSFVVSLLDVRDAAKPGYQQVRRKNRHEECFFVDGPPFLTTKSINPLRINRPHLKNLVVECHQIVVNRWRRHRWVVMRYNCSPQGSPFSSCQANGFRSPLLLEHHCSIHLEHRDDFIRVVHRGSFSRVDMKPERFRQVDRIQLSVVPGRVLSLVHVAILIRKSSVATGLMETIGRCSDASVLGVCPPPFLLLALGPTTNARHRLIAAVRGCAGHRSSRDVFRLTRRPTARRHRTVLISAFLAMLADHLNPRRVPQPPARD